jgi:quercetin dioxygenase-like cupin family protein
MAHQINSAATILVGAETTAGRLALIETVERRGEEPPCHRHYWEDELIYVLAGELALYIEGKWLSFPPARAVMVPRSVEHTFAVLSDTARLLTVFTPAGFEGFYRELGQAGGDVYILERWVATAARFGCEITGPHPGSPEA